MIGYGVGIYSQKLIKIKAKMILIITFSDITYIFNNIFEYFVVYMFGRIYKYTQYNSVFYVYYTIIIKIIFFVDFKHVFCCFPDFHKI